MLYEVAKINGQLIEVKVAAEVVQPRTHAYGLGKTRAVRSTLYIYVWSSLDQTYAMANSRV